MAKSLVIVESPAKAKTIKKYLGKSFDVEASSGHLIDLPVSKLGVDIENDFEPQYVVIKGKSKFLNQLKKAAKGAEKVYLASDPDREGEAIAWHIAEKLNIRDKSERVLIHEITEKAIKDSINNPTTLSQDRFEAQQARRVLDRLVGYQVSPILWKKLRRGLSAGRVQSVAVRLVVEREREIEAFKPVEYWSIESDLKRKQDTESDLFKASLHKYNGKKAEISTEEQANSILDSIRGNEFKVTSVERKDRKRNALPPFITSTLQREASLKLRYSAKQTMALAQRLYEGVDLGSEGPVGLITYMRTDSVRVSDVAMKEVRALIKESYGTDFLPAKPNTFKVKKSAQDAHEAIRPTFVAKSPDSVKEFLKDDEYNLYKLIWQRFIASQMNPMIYDQTTLEISAGKALFRATGSIIKFAGFSAVYIESMEEEEEAREKDEMRKLPDVGKGDVLDLLNLEGKQHFTQPPPRFTESSLVKELEEKGIGRPSTYAAILSTIQDREYVIREKSKLKPTDLGFSVNDLLIQGFPEIMDVKFTAEMEEQLDKVEDGDVNWVMLLKAFYKDFAARLREAEKGTPTDIDCDKCGAQMIIKLGRNGEFLSCSRYPECKNAKPFNYGPDGKIVELEREEPELRHDIKCEKCGSPMAIKNSRRGEFLACSAYPKCKNAKPFEYDDDGNIKVVEKQEPKVAEDVLCDKCSSPMVIKNSRKGEFLACSAYPKCRNAKSFKYDDEGKIKILEKDEPEVREDVKCEKCGKPMALRSGRFGKFFGCTGYPKCRNIVKANDDGKVADTSVEKTGKGREESPDEQKTADIN